MSDEMQCNHIECEIRGCDCGCHVPDFTPRCQIAAHQGSLADDPQAVERARKAAEPYALLSGLEMQEVLRAAEGEQT